MLFFWFLLATNKAAYIWLSCHDDPLAHQIREQMDAVLDIPFFPCVSIGWDDTPRFPAKGVKDVVHYHNTPESFAMLLLKAKEYADSHPEQPKMAKAQVPKQSV
jgi:hypothetical protein